ncbi:MAG: aldehyde ferredoxin oxidoreductase N-terminal domain-containing protein, partial [Oscillospiraceae bacterium]
MMLPVYIMINLSDGTSSPYEISQKDFEQCLGGKILGARLLTDLTPAGIDPLGQESVVIINSSPMTGTGAPSTSRFNMTFKNVLTGGIGSSNCGGQFGVMLKRAGYDGLILKGCSAQPVTIEIVDGKVNLNSAADLWGLDTEAVQEKLPKGY